MTCSDRLALLSLLNVGAGEVTALVMDGQRQHLKQEVAVVGGEVERESERYVSCTLPLGFATATPVTVVSSCCLAVMEGEGREQMTCRALMRVALT